MTDMASRIKDFMSHYGLTQVELAEKCGISQSNLSQALKSGIVGEQIIIGISNLYSEISLEWLIRGEGDMLRRAEGYVNDTNHAYKFGTVDPVFVKLLDLLMSTDKTLKILGTELNALRIYLTNNSAK